MNFSIELFLTFFFVIIYSLIFLKYFKYLAVSYDFTKKIFLKFFLRSFIFGLFILLLFNIKNDDNSSNLINTKILTIQLSDQDYQLPDIENQLLNYLSSQDKDTYVKLTLNEEYSLVPTIKNSQLVSLIKNTSLSKLPLLKIQDFNEADVIFLDFNKIKERSNVELGKSDFKINLYASNNSTFTYYLVILLLILNYLDFQINYRVAKD